MTEKFPLVSVIIPVYNHAAYLEKCIKSIWNQEYKNIQIVAIDDGSVDESYSILKNLKNDSPLEMVILTQKNMGSCKTVNKAISLCSGEYVTMIASDDFYNENNLSQLIYEAIKYPSVQLFYSNGRYFTEDVVKGLVHNDPILSFLKRDTKDLLYYISSNVPRPLLIQTCIIKKSLLISINGLDESCKIDDWVLNIKMLQFLVLNNLNHLYVDIDLFRYRIHNSNFHSNSIVMINSIVDIANKYLKGRNKSLLLAKEYFYYGFYFVRKFKLLIGLSFMIKSIINLIKYIFNIN